MAIILRLSSRDIACGENINYLVLLSNRFDEVNSGLTLFLGCNFYSVCGGVFGLTSIATMASISITRLAAVNDPFSSLTLTSGFTLGLYAHRREVKHEEAGD